MDIEAAAKQITGPCVCHGSYTYRGMNEPDWRFHKFHADIVDALRKAQDEAYERCASDFSYVVEEMRKWVVQHYPDPTNHSYFYSRPRALISAQLRCIREIRSLKSSPPRKSDPEGTDMQEIKGILRKVQDEAYERAAEMCERRYPCGDPYHDDRWCSRCSAFLDCLDLLADAIRSLKSKGETK